MQCIIDTLGYGYSKQLCEDVTVWFLSNYLRRYKVEITILHRGLKRENVLGYCDFTESSYRPRKFLIELQTHMEREEYITTLLHELVHVRQWVIGSLQLFCGKLCYNKDPVESYSYDQQPHEIEAHKQEKILYQKYLLNHN